METSSAIYNCGMQILYIICSLGWALCKKNLAAFAAFKSLYTQAYIDGQLLAVKNAEAIKNNSSRRTKGNVLRMDVEQAARTVCANWQSLKKYIEQSFKKPRLQIMLDDAGARYYNAAYSFNWADMQLLCRAGNSMIAENMAKLTTDGYMPATFATQFATNADVFLDLCDAYMANSGDTRETTMDKVMANNAIYTSLLAMLKDSQVIFKAAAQKAIKDQFTFAALKVLAAGNGAGSIRGVVTDSLTGKTVSGATITVVNENMTATTNKRGAYKLDRVAAGVYQVEVLKEGLVKQTITVTVETSTMATVNVSLSAAMFMQIKAA